MKVAKNIRMKKLVIGFVGSVASGKETAINHLKKKHKAVSLSLSDEVRSELTSVGFENPSRETLQATGNLLRKFYGKAVLAKRVGEKIKKTKVKLVLIDGIRYPDEAQFLRKIKNCFIISLDAKPKVRCERLKRRGRIGDPRTWKEFLDCEEKENNKLLVRKSMKKSDFALENNGTLDTLFGKVDKIIKEVRK